MRRDGLRRTVSALRRTRLARHGTENAAAAARLGGAADLGQGRMPAAGRQLQIARREQPAAASERGGARARRGRFLLGQSRPGRGPRRAARSASQATIVMPRDAPAVKVEGTRAAGAEIVFFDRATESREAIGARLAAETGATLVPALRRCRRDRGAGQRRGRDRGPARRAAAAGDRALRRRRPVRRHRFGPAGIADRRGRARGLGRHDPLARARPDRAGRGAGAADPLRRAPDQIGLAAHLRRAARRGRARRSR